MGGHGPYMAMTDSEDLHQHWIDKGIHAAVRKWLKVQHGGPKPFLPASSISQFVQFWQCPATKSGDAHCSSWHQHPGLEPSSNQLTFQLTNRYIDIPRFQLRPPPARKH
jgi:hypothetical protein